MSLNFVYREVSAVLIFPPSANFFWAELISILRPWLGPVSTTLFCKFSSFKSFENEVDDTVDGFRLIIMY